MTQILLFSGSNRKNSFNQRLMRYCAQRLRARANIDIIEASEVTLPLFNQDLETDGDVMSSVAAMYARFAAADGFVFLSPEYNASLSPFFKNTLDWVSRLPYINAQIPSAFLHRPVLLGSAVTGWSGGAFGMTHARSVMTYLGAITLAEQLSISYADRFWDGETASLPPDLSVYIEHALSHLIEVAERPRFGNAESFAV